MCKTGVFYLLPQINKKYQEKKFIEKLVCHLVKKQWRIGRSILICCDEKNQAIELNKNLWEFDQDSFLPHGLFGKNARNLPITIYWEQCCYDDILRDVLINLMKKNKNFFFTFKKIIDFVPKTNLLKNLARNRYKDYKNMGFKLTTYTII